MGQASHSVVDVIIAVWCLWAIASHSSICLGRWRCGIGHWGSSGRRCGSHGWRWACRWGAIGSSACLVCVGDHGIHWWRCSAWLGVSMCRNWGHSWAWGLGGTVRQLGWWCGAVSCRRRRRRRHWRACSWVHMISHRATGRCTHGSGWPHRWGSCVVLPSWGHGLWLLRVWVVATRGYNRGRWCALCRGQSRTRARAGRLRRGMGWRTSHWRSGQKRLAWRRWVGSEWWRRLVGADWGSRLVWPRGVKSRSSHAIADTWQLLQA